MRIALTLLFVCGLISTILADEPKLRDPQGKFEIQLFASAPLIVNPISIQSAGNDKVWVIESHTHFRPQNYAGPAKDRVLLLEDTNGDGQADKKTIFHEGFTASMDLLAAGEGKLYVAERSAIHLLTDKDGDGKADDDQLIVKLETAGNYPHNGLSGLTFDGHGGLYFGLGENLGAAYKLVGSDGGTLSGEAEGGSIYHMQRDGGKLRRVATGMWNPFGICVDKSGNIFATDNDPDSSPPCRLLHVVEGGDYGYEFRYGRSGLHPFQCWNGELPGTLPMLSGIGEAPCEIVPWDNGLLIASWADNRLEHYTLKIKGLSFEVQQTVLVSGDLNFRPVGIAVAKDGALYVSDWASASYELPGTGRIWKLTPKQPAREEAQRYPRNESDEYLDFMSQPFVPAARYLDHSDPFFRQQAIDVMSRYIANGRFDRFAQDVTPAGRPALVIAFKRAGKADKLPEFLIDKDPQVRIAALKWVADQRLSEHRAAIEAGLKSPQLTRELLAAYLATLERLDSAKVTGSLPKPELVLPILNDANQSPAVRRYALMLLPPDHKALDDAKLRELLNVKDEALSREVIRTMLLARHAERIKLLDEIAQDDSQSVTLRAAAIAGLAGSGEYKGFLVETATGNDKTLQAEALRSLVDLPLDPMDKERLAKLGDEPEVTRLLGKSAAIPANTDIAAWLKLTAGDGDAAAGARIFFHNKVGYCARCHKYDGRGQQVGPDLTRIAERATPEWLLTAILNPSRDVAPAYRQWQIETKDGQQLIGLSLRKGSHAEDYLGLDGKPFTVRLDQIEERRESPLSMMPAGFEQQLTPRELRDLLAFLLQKR